MRMRVGELVVRDMKVRMVYDDANDLLERGLWKESFEKPPPIKRTDRVLSTRRENGDGSTFHLFLFWYIILIKHFYPFNPKSTNQSFRLLLFSSSLHILMPSSCPPFHVCYSHKIQSHSRVLGWSRWLEGSVFLPWSVLKKNLLGTQKETPQGCLIFFWFKFVLDYLLGGLAVVWGVLYSSIPVSSYRHLSHTLYPSGMSMDSFCSCFAFYSLDDSLHGEPME